MSSGHRQRARRPAPGPWPRIRRGSFQGPRRQHCDLSVGHRRHAESLECLPWLWTPPRGPHALPISGQEARTRRQPPCSRPAPAMKERRKLMPLVHSGLPGTVGVSGRRGDPLAAGPMRRDPAPAAGLGSPAAPRAGLPRRGLRAATLASTARQGFHGGMPPPFAPERVRRPHSRQGLSGPNAGRGPPGPAGP